MNSLQWATNDNEQHSTCYVSPMTGWKDIFLYAKWLCQQFLRHTYTNQLKWIYKLKRIYCTCTSSSWYCIILYNNMKYCADSISTHAASHLDEHVLHYYFKENVIHYFLPNICQGLATHSKAAWYANASMYCSDRSGMVEDAQTQGV